MQLQLSKQTTGSLIKQRQHELYRSSTSGPNYATLIQSEQLLTMTKTLCSAASC